MGNAINRALTQLDTLQKSDNRFRGVARAGLLLRSASKQTIGQPPVKTIAKTTPALAAQPVPNQQKPVTQQQEPRRWLQGQRTLFDPIINEARPVPAAPRSAPTAPAPTMAQSIRASRDLTPLSGHQLAARKAGLDINTPGLDKLSFDQMKQAANQVNVEAARKQAEAQGIYRGPAGEPYHRK